MKKLILAFVAVMTMTAAQAQGDNNQGNGERPRVDRTEMLKRRTDDAVKKYGLNEEQAAKLEEQSQLKLTQARADYEQIKAAGTEYHKSFTQLIEQQTQLLKQSALYTGD